MAGRRDFLRWLGFGSVAGACGMAKGSPKGSNGLPYGPVFDELREQGVWFEGHYFTDGVGRVIQVEARVGHERTVSASWRPSVVTMPPAGWADVVEGTVRRDGRASERQIALVRRAVIAWQEQGEQV